MAMSIPVGTDVIIQNSTIFPQLNGFHAVIATDGFIHEKLLWQGCRFDGPLMELTNGEIPGHTCQSDVPWGYGWNLPITDIAPVEYNLAFDINSLI